MKAIVENDQEQAMIIEQIIRLIEASASGSDSELRAKMNTLMKGAVLHAEIKELTEYRRVEKGRIASAHGVKFQQYALYFLFQNEVAEMIGESWRNTKDKDSTQYRINATTKLFRKSHQTMLDLLALFECGALPSSLTLWRSMYENYVFSKYLLESPDGESDRFNDYAVIQTSQMSMEYKRTNQALIGSLLEKYGDEYSRPYGWVTRAEKKSIDGIIAFVKEKEFADHYRFSSMQLHASSFSVNKSIFHDGEHGNADMLGVFTEGMELPFNLAIKLMARYAETMISFFTKDEMKDLLLASNQLLFSTTAMPLSTEGQV